MAPYRLIFRVHAIQRMFQRGISEQDVRRVLENGTLVEEYPDDAPYPSKLVLGWSGRRPIHVVVADNYIENQVIVVTVYEPDADEWERNFTERKP